MVQRLGLVFLKSKVASWRYKRGSRSLTLNLNLEKVTEDVQEKIVLHDDEDEDYDVPDEIEDVIEELLAGLKDKETIVRWTAAKGINKRTISSDLNLRSIPNIYHLQNDEQPPEPSYKI